MCVRAPLKLLPGTSFQTPPAYVFNTNDIVDRILNGIPLTEDPAAATFIQGGLFLNVDMSNATDGGGTGTVNNADFFFDTGADVTVVSELNAARLGFDPVLDEPAFTVSILGSGGTISAVPGFFVDEMRVSTVGGEFTAENVPIIVLDITDPSNAGNILPGLVGTNIFNGRNMVIDPNPSLGGGGVGPSVYIGDPVTTVHAWSTEAASANWRVESNWGASETPNVMWVTDLRPVGDSDQVAVVEDDSTVWEVSVGGKESHRMELRVVEDATLTTFSAVNVDLGGTLVLEGGVLDAQFVELFGGSFRGTGELRVGNGPIPGQFENRGGIISVGDGAGETGTLNVQGILSNIGDGVLQFELAGTSDAEYDRILVEGTAALEGILEVALVADFRPQVGDSFTLIDTSEGLGGGFDLQFLPNGYDWDVIFEENSLRVAVVGVGLAGDLNGDGDVDALDAAILFANWGMGSTIADLNADGLTDAADAGVLYGAWTGDANVPVPEPSGSWLAACACLAIFRNRSLRWNTKRSMVR